MTISGSQNPVPISIVIPTYGREQALIDSIESLLALKNKAAEIIVVDQSEYHKPEVMQQLASWHEDDTIKLISLPQPSIPQAMNTGLLTAKQAIILFVDDDIKAHEYLALVHYDSHQQKIQNLIVAGRVIQPWDENQKLIDGGHQFNSIEKKNISHFMGGNFSINKDQAISIGGFDENFIGVAYRFEAEFAQRWINAGYKIQFEPAAAIDHLKVSSGGTREYGEHLTTVQPYHAVGAYYHLLIAGKGENKFLAVLNRLLKSIKTRHHLKRPWYIPLTLIAEIRGLTMARSLAKAGPRFINKSDRASIGVSNNR